MIKKKKNYHKIVDIYYISKNNLNVDPITMSNHLLVELGMG